MGFRAIAMLAYRPHDQRSLQGRHRPMSPEDVPGGLDAFSQAEPESLISDTA